MVFVLYSPVVSRSFERAGLESASVMMLLSKCINIFTYRCGCMTPIGLPVREVLVADGCMV